MGDLPDYHEYIVPAPAIPDIEVGPMLVAEYDSTPEDIPDGEKGPILIDIKGRLWALVDHRRIAGTDLKSPTISASIPMSVENPAIAYEAATDRFKCKIESSINLIADITDDWTRQLGLVDLSRVLGAALSKTNPVLIGGTYEATPPTLSDGDAHALTLTSDGKVRTYDPLVFAQVQTRTHVEIYNAVAAIDPPTEAEIWAYASRTLTSHAFPFTNPASALDVSNIRTAGYPLLTHGTYGLSALQTIIAETNAYLESGGAIYDFVDEIESLLKNGTYGLSAIETLVDEVESLLKNGTYGLSALDTDLGTILTRIGDPSAHTLTSLVAKLGDLPADLKSIIGTAILTGASERTLSDTPYIFVVLSIGPAAHPDMNAAHRPIEAFILNFNGAAPTAAEITPGTVTINRWRGNGMSTIVSGAAMSESTGYIYYSYTFPSASWASGDKYNAAIEGVAVTKGGKTLSLPPLIGRGFIP